ncbi:MAG TPA: LPXTG cell wall anchor domain-containing protein [Micromonosporaceae bacterium]
MKRLLAVLTATGLAGLGTFAVSQPAYATQNQPIPVVSDCTQEWYVNPDEGDLLPEQTEGGLLFDGPSLVHHATNVLLSDLQPGTFVATLDTGVLPLFKVETDSPYSTLNYVGDGTTDLWWSSKILATDPGGQNNPIAAADFIGKATTGSGNPPYTSTTHVFSFGVGYANDVGNKATVSSVTFDGQTYDLTCQPEPTDTTAAPTTTQPGSEGTLPKTGSNVTVIAGIAGLLIVAGVASLVVARVRRR